jgi:hypothetical protein
MTIELARLFDYPKLNFVWKRINLGEPRLQSCHSQHFTPTRTGGENKAFTLTTSITSDPLMDSN